MKDRTEIQIVVSRILETPSYIEKLEDFELQQLIIYYRNEDIAYAGFAMSANPPLEKRQFWNWQQNDLLGEIVSNEIMRRNKVEEPATSPIAGEPEFFKVEEPATSPIAGEPEFFKRVFLNPEQNIPFLLKSLKELGFISSDSGQWRTEFSRYCISGILTALIEDKKHSFFVTTNWTQLTNVFCERFGLPKEPRIEKGKGRFGEAETKLKEYLKRNRPN
jgi:hypothetical protein